MTTSTKATTPRMAPCEGCRTATETTKLFYLRQKRLCLVCGQREIANWNRLVRESEARDGAGGEGEALRHGRDSVDEAGVGGPGRTEAGS